MKNPRPDQTIHPRCHTGKERDLLSMRLARWDAKPRVGTKIGTALANLSPADQGESDRKVPRPGLRFSEWRPDCWDRSEGTTVLRSRSKCDLSPCRYR